MVPVGTPAQGVSYQIGRNTGMWLLLAGGDYYPPWVKPWVAVVVSRRSEVEEAEHGVDPLMSQRRRAVVLVTGQANCL